MLAGQAGAETIYWVGVALEPTDGSNTFWENSTAGVLGSGQAYDDGSGVFVIDPALEGVYSIAGTCSPISGPPVLSLPLTFEAQTVPFVDFNGSATQAIPNPDASGINTSATVAETLFQQQRLLQELTLLFLLILHQINTLRWMCGLLWLTHLFY